MNPMPVYAVVLLSAAAQAASPPPTAAVSLSENPLVMRMSKDEFRIAFGINGKHCAHSGCYGLIHYRVNWQAEDGTLRSEVKQVSYAIAPHSGRSLAVDRQYFDTSEGAHTTEVLAVSVDRITCLADVPQRPL